MKSKVAQIGKKTLESIDMEDSGRPSIEIRATHWGPLKIEAKNQVANCCKENNSPELREEGESDDFFVLFGFAGFVFALGEIGAPPLAEQVLVQVAQLLQETTVGTDRPADPVRKDVRFFR